MLATGKSMIAAIDALLKNGTPSKLYIVALLASKEGLQYVQDNLPMPASIWVGDVDEELNSKAYIVPGLGDAGDLAFGGD
jgi:uracil phosphoribosyltransferase